MGFMNNGINKHEIPADKLAAAQQLREWAAAGWHVLDGMDEAALDAFEQEHVRAAASPSPIPFDGPHALAINAAREEIRRRRIQCRIAQAEHAREQQGRVQNITKAANLVREARRLVGYAHGVLRDAEPIPGEIDTPDIHAMNRGQLDNLLASYKAEIQRIGDYPGKLQADADEIKLLKGKDASAIARELTKDAGRWDARLSSLRIAAGMVEARIEKLESEQAEREAEREKIQSNLPEIVGELQARIAELEKDAG